MALDLRVPTERAAPPKDLELRPKQVKAWVESLPLSQSAEAGRKILANLCAINRTKVDFDDRMQIWEAYRPIAQVVLDELDAVYGKSLLPLPPKAREALALARELTIELGYGYKTLILEKTGKLLAFGAKKQMPFLAYRAMESLVQLLRASYRSYTPIPAGAWQEIHTLYLHAEKEGFAADPADPESKASLADLYSETLLVALTDPYRLIPGELDRDRAGDPQPARRMDARPGEARRPGRAGTSSCPATWTGPRSRCCPPATTPAGPTGASSTPTRSSTGCARAARPWRQATSRPRPAGPWARR